MLINRLQQTSFVVIWIGNNIKTFKIFSRSIVTCSYSYLIFCAMVILPISIQRSFPAVIPQSAYTKLLKLTKAMTHPLNSVTTQRYQRDNFKQINNHNNTKTFFISST